MSDEQNTNTDMIQGDQLKLVLEAALLAAGQPLSMAQLQALFRDEERPPHFTTSNFASSSPRPRARGAIGLRFHR